MTANFNYDLYPVFLILKWGIPGHSYPYFGLFKIVFDGYVIENKCCR